MFIASIARKRDSYKDAMRTSGAADVHSAGQAAAFHRPVLGGFACVPGAACDAPSPPAPPSPRLKGREAYRKGRAAGLSVPICIVG